MTTTSSTDVFGNTSTTLTTLTQTLYKGKFVTLGTVSNTTSKDVFGGTIAGSSSVTNTYIVDSNNYIVLSSVVTVASPQSGSDIYGNIWTQDSSITTTQRYYWNGSYYAYMYEILDATGITQSYNPFDEATPIFIQTKTT